MGRTAACTLITRTEAIVAKLGNSIKNCVYLTFRAHVVADKLFLRIYSKNKKEAVVHLTAQYQFFLE